MSWAVEPQYITLSYTFNCNYFFNKYFVTRFVHFWKNAPFTRYHTFEILKFSNEIIFHETIVDGGKKQKRTLWI